MSPMQNPPPPRGHLDFLDGWRGAAIAAVLLGHFAPVGFINVGRLGVELFFVLSGRLMAEILLVRQEPLGRFFWRRFSRIYPTLLLFLLVCWWAVPGGSGLAPEGKAVVAAATLTINYLHTSGWGAHVFDHIWSLCVEEHSYLLLGLLVWGFGRDAWRLERALTVLAMAAMAHGAWQTWWAGDPYYTVYWRSDTRSGAILLAAALYLRRQRLVSSLPSAGWWTAVAAMGLLLSTARVPDPLKYSAGTWAFAWLVVHLDAAPAWVMLVLRSRALRMLGVCSFSLYLWQQPIYAGVLGVSGPWMALPAIALGLACHHLWERPARRWLNARWPSAPRPATVNQRAST
jgi:peptidoglycan/LPS O-acetylase OafA/YrhL